MATSDPVVIDRVPANKLADMIAAFGPGFSAAVQPNMDGSFTVTETPIAATGSPPSAPARADTQSSSQVLALPVLAEAPGRANGGDSSALVGVSVDEEAFNPGPETQVNYLDLIPLPPKSTFNVGLASTGQHRLMELLGAPVLDGQYSPSGECRKPNNPTLLARLVQKSVGPFNVTGLDVAVISLAAILLQVKTSRPRLFGMLGTQGMECARFTKINGNIGPSVSTHSWGIAIDLTLGGKTDEQGDSEVLRGSLELARFFNAARWYWGAGFPTEDGMHFEPSAGLVEDWHSAGKL